MVGQEKILKQLFSYNLDILPRTLLLIGESGCGKNTLIKEMSNHYNLNIVDITDNIDNDLINDIYLNSIPNIYVINLDFINEKQQNVILKFIEEPLKNSFLMLKSSLETHLLDTIKNRCQIFRFDNYSAQELIQFIPEKHIQNQSLITEIYRTPGKILKANLDLIIPLYELCCKIVDRISNANLSNTLTIADKLNYKDEYDKFDINDFITTMLLIIKDRYINNNYNPVYYQMMLITNDLNNKLRFDKLNRQNLIKIYLIDIWRLFRD